MPLIRWRGHSKHRDKVGLAMDRQDGNELGFNHTNHP